MNNISSTLATEEISNLDKVETRCKVGEIWALGRHRLLVSDSTSYEAVKILVGTQEFHAIITDPPYGLGISDWDKVTDIASITHQVKSFGLEFYAVFGQMPTILDWHLSAKSQSFHFCEHIVWVKRIVTPSQRLSRGHESIYIYAINKSKKFYNTKGLFEDVKLPGVLVDSITLEGVDRYIKDLRNKLVTGNSKINTLSPRQLEYQRFNKVLSDRSPEFVNFTNVWSFMPPTQSNRKNNYCHPTEKPLELVVRLVEMLTPNNGTVLDFFLGSGTTLIACEKSNRTCFGCEINPTYADIILNRWEMLTNEKAHIIKSTPALHA